MTEWKELNETPEEYQGFIYEIKNKLNGISDKLFTLQRSGEINGVSSENGTTSPPPNNTLTQTPKNTYYIAYSDYLKKNYDLAIEGFFQFLKQFPNNNLADNSLYWIGECYYSQKKYPDAVRVFTKLSNIN